MNKQVEFRDELQAHNFKHIKGMKLTMNYEVRSDGIYLIGTCDNGISYELAVIKTKTQDK